MLATDQQIRKMIRARAETTGLGVHRAAGMGAQQRTGVHACQGWKLLQEV